MRPAYTLSIIAGVLLTAAVFLLSSAQGKIHARRIDATTGSPGKVLGIPAPDEWIEIESNEVGQPGTVYAVPGGHRLTLDYLALASRFAQSTAGSPRNMSMRVSINGALFVEMTTDPGLHVSRAGSPTHWEIQPGMVLGPGATLILERFDDGNTIANPADPAHTFAVRGFLEVVRG